MARRSRQDFVYPVFVNFSVQGKAQIEALKATLDATSTTAVIRQAVAVYSALHAERSAGRQVIVRDHDGTEREVFLFFMS